MTGTGQDSARIRSTFALRNNVELCEIWCLSTLTTCETIAGMEGRAMTLNLAARCEELYMVVTRDAHILLEVLHDETPTRWPVDSIKRDAVRLFHHAEQLRQARQQAREEHA